MPRRRQTGWVSVLQGLRIRVPAGCRQHLLVGHGPQPRPHLRRHAVL